MSLKDLHLYTGFTTDLYRRLQEHVRGLVAATELRIPFKLVHYEYFVNETDARAREMYLKSAAGRKELQEKLNKTLRSYHNLPYNLQFSSHLSRKSTRGL